MLHAAPGEESLRSAEKLLDLMTSSPALQQMMLASMPAHLRANPEMLKKILSDPGMKAKMAEMIAKQVRRWRRWWCCCSCWQRWCCRDANALWLGAGEEQRATRGTGGLQSVVREGAREHKAVGGRTKPTCALARLACSGQGVKFPPHVLDRLNASHMEDTMNRLRKVRACVRDGRLRCAVPWRRPCVCAHDERGTMN